LQPTETGQAASLAISPPSDIVLDVARAAEPATLETARAKLASRAAVAGMAEVFSVGDLRNSPLGREESTDDTSPKSYVDFEAMVLQTFVQAMMPKDAEDVYGGGMAGDMWKSMMSQQLGTVMADRGGIGIADSLLKGHYMEGETKVALSGVSDGPEKDRLDQERSLSTALVQEMQRRLTSDIAGQTAPSMDRK
jgi:peptidoglycan hydrolase FlgJ